MFLVSICSLRCAITTASVSFRSSTTFLLARINPSKLQCWVKLGIYNCNSLLVVKVYHWFVVDWSSKSLLAKVYQSFTSIQVICWSRGMHMLRIITWDLPIIVVLSRIHDAIVVIGLFFRLVHTCIIVYFLNFLLQDLANAFYLVAHASLNVRLYVVTPA